jgi:hypothetical protein
MTRDAEKFPKWTVGTVDKAFKWADYLSEVSKVADVVQMQAIVQKGLLVNTNISAVNNNPMLVLDDPIETLVHAIISSPYLSWMEHSKAVLRRTFHCIVERKGEKESTRICVDALKGTIESRISFNGIWEAASTSSADAPGGGGDRQAVQTTPGAVARAFGPDELSLAFELVVAWHFILLSSPSSSTTAAAVVVEEGKLGLLRAAREDLITLRMMCIALTLSPARVAVLTEVYHQNHSQSQSQSTDLLPDWERLYLVSKCSALVEVATTVIRESFSRFVSIDDDQGSLLSLLCQLEEGGNDEFVRLFAELHADE